jgi:ribonuclease-3
MNPTELLKHIPAIERIIGYSFYDNKLLQLSFVHRSYINEHKEVKGHNERLEFLGDAVLGLLISEYIYNKFPHLPEGELSFLRARLVEASSCAVYVQKLGLSKYILLGKGEIIHEGKGTKSILADLFEAVIGALFLDGGLNAAKRFVFDHLSTEIEKILEMPRHNWKALLQDFCQKKYQETPTYTVLEASGPDHSKTFHVAVLVNKEKTAEGLGQSKKEAEQQAAEHALRQLKPELFQK